MNLLAVELMNLLAVELMNNLFNGNFYIFVILFKEIALTSLYKYSAFSNVDFKISNMSY